MLRKTVEIVSICAALTLAGCAATTTNYTSPQAYNFETERFLDTVFTTAWDQYVAELSKSFFVINNISKESRIINISFSSNTPSTFVDCGRTRRETKHPSVGTQTFDYAVADDSTFLYGEKGTNKLWRVTRDTRLEGRANVYMAPMAPEGDKTLLRANAKYVFTVHKSAYLNVGGSVADSVTLDFSSNQPGSKTEQTAEGPVTWQCVSNGTLERQLLDLIPAQ